jgi:hypothetical protein
MHATGRIAAATAAMAVVEADRSWVLSSPAGDEARFSSDFSRSGPAGGDAGGDAVLGTPDVEFSFDAAPFVAAGVDPARIQGWAFAKVETKDEAGKPIQVDKLLRPFDL